MKQLGKTMRRKKQGDAPPPPMPPRKPSKFKAQASDDAIEDDENDDRFAPARPGRARDTGRAARDDTPEEVPDWFDENDGAPPVPPRWSRGERKSRERTTLRRAARAAQDAVARQEADEAPQFSFETSRAREDPAPAQSSSNDHASGGAGYSWEQGGAASRRSPPRANAAATPSAWALPKRAAEEASSGYSFERSGGAAPAESAPASSSGGGAGYSWETAGSKRASPKREAKPAAWARPAAQASDTRRASPKRVAAPSAWTLPKQRSAAPPPASSSGGGGGGGYSWESGARQQQPAASTSDAPSAWALPKRAAAAASDWVDSFRNPAPAAQPAKPGPAWQQAARRADPAPAAYSWQTSGASDDDDRAGNSARDAAPAAQGYSWEQPSGQQQQRPLSKRASLANALRRLSGARPARGGSDAAASALDPASVTYSHGSGCYLAFDARSGGVLCAHWSEDGTAPGNALAYFRPQKKVPRFKYSQNKGRVEMSQVRGSKARLFEGVVLFCKEALAWRGSLMPLAHTNALFDLYALRGRDRRVVQLGNDEFFDMTQFEAVAALPRQSLALEGISTTSRGHFLTVGNGAGFATPIG